MTTATHTPTTPTQPAPTRDAQAYADQAQQAAMLLWKVGEALRQHQQRTEASPGPAWGQAGDLQRVNAQLADLLATLTGGHN